MQKKTCLLLSLLSATTTALSLSLSLSLPLPTAAARHALSLSSLPRTSRVFFSFFLFFFVFSHFPHQSPRWCVLERIEYMYSIMYVYGRTTTFWTPLLLLFFFFIFFFFIRLFYLFICVVMFLFFNLKSMFLLCSPVHINFERPSTASYSAPVSAGPTKTERKKNNKHFHLEMFASN